MPNLLFNELLLKLYSELLGPVRMVLMLALYGFWKEHLLVVKEIILVGCIRGEVVLLKFMFLNEVFTKGLNRYRTAHCLLGGLILTQMHR